MNRSRRLAALAAASLGAGALILAGAPHAEAKRISSCTIKVAGKTWLKGPCDYTSDPDGSFTVTDPKMVIACDVNNDNKPDKSDDCAMAEMRMFKKGAFVYVSVLRKGVADAAWNRGTDLHAQTNLGELKRNGACWSNKTATICASK